jgi:hypothetical protein
MINKFCSATPLTKYLPGEIILRPSAGCQVYPARYGGNGQKKALLIVRRALNIIYIYRQAWI